MIKAIFLDIDNTLLDFNLNGYYALESAFNKVGVGFKKEYFPVFSKINAELWDKLGKKVITREELKKERFKLVFSELGVSGDHDSAEDIYRNELAEFTFYVDGAIDLLKYLGGKYRLFAATNAVAKYQEYRLKKAQIYDYFEKVFISENAGCDKPSKDFFDYCFSFVDGVTPDQAVMIGDSLNADIIGGKKYGMTTVWVNPNGNANPVPDCVDYEIKALSEIKAFL